MIRVYQIMAAFVFKQLKNIYYTLHINQLKLLFSKI